MRSLLFVALLCAVCVNVRVELVWGFTVGYLLPDYICHPAGDGLPKSLGTYLPFVQRLSPGIVNAFQANQDGTSILPTQYILANWHNRNNTAACKAVFTTNTSVTVGATTYINTIVPGQVHQITLQINAHDFITPKTPAAGQATCDVGDGATTSLDVAALALDGGLIYAVDSSAHRVGTWTNPGPNMQYMPACGPWGVGVVHNQLLSNNQLVQGIYVGLQWAAPGYLAVGSTLTFQGAGVSDAGFGSHSTTWTVAAIPPNYANLSVATPIITYATWLGANLVVFFDPQNMAGVNTQVTAGSYTLYVQNAATLAASTNSISIPGFLASPATVAWSTISSAALTGNSMFVSVKAVPVAGSNTTARLAATSVGYPLSIPTAAPSATITLTQAASVCNATYLQDTQFFSMYANDNQCSYQATLFVSGSVAATTVKASAAAPIAAVNAARIFLLIIAAVAAIVSLQQH